MACSTVPCCRSRLTLLAAASGAAGGGSSRGSPGLQGRPELPGRLPSDAGRERRPSPASGPWSLAAPGCPCQSGEPRVARGKRLRKGVPEALGLLHVAAEWGELRRGFRGPASGQLVKRNVLKSVHTATEPDRLRHADAAWPGTTLYTTDTGAKHDLSLGPNLAQQFDDWPHWHEPSLHAARGS